MPILMERRPSTYEYDPNIFRRVRIGEAQLNQGSGEVIINNREAGVIGLVSPHETGNQTDSETAADVSRVLREELANNFDTESPEDSMKRAFEAAEQEISDSSPEEGCVSTGVDASAVKVYSRDGSLHATYGTLGRQHIYIAKGNTIDRLNDYAEDDQEEDDQKPVKGLGMPVSKYEDPQIGTVELSAGDRLVIQSSDAVGYSEEEYLQPDERDKAMAANSPRKSAKLFSQRAGSAVVLDVRDGHDGGLSWMTRMTNLNRLRNDNEASDNEASSRRTNQRRGLGRLSLAGAYLGARATTWRQDWAERRDGRLVVDDDGEADRSSKLKKAAVIGALVVGGILAWKYGFDHGNGADNGIDLWPFGGGDINDGDSSGWDLNPTNENLNFNDDPVDELFIDTKGFDLAPPFIDGDWFSLTDVDLVTPDIDLVPDVDVPEVEVPNLDLDLVPDVDVPEVEVPIVEPVAPPPPPIWTPDVFTVENGNGLIQDIHEIGHEVVGNYDFDTSDSRKVYEAVQAQYGDTFLELPNHTGPDLYHYGSELRISAPGRAHWASQEIENFVHEKILEMAAA